MRIITLGTGHGDSTFSRFKSSNVYECRDGSLYMIDCGEPAEALLRRKGLKARDVRAVFITHMHEDHAGGLPGLLKQVIKYPCGSEEPIRVFLPELSTLNALKAWMKAIYINADSPLLQFAQSDPGPIYEDENIAVTGIRTQHLKGHGGEFASISYILDFKQEHKTVLHTGDLRGDFTDFPKIASERHFDVCITEATHHMPDAAVPTLEHCLFDRLILTHVYDRWNINIGTGWEVDNGERRLLSFYQNLPYPTCVAHDGSEFVL